MKRKIKREKRKRMKKISNRTLVTLITILLGICIISSVSLTAKPTQTSMEIIEAVSFNTTCSVSLGQQCVDQHQWPVPFVDSNYVVTCTGINAHVVPLLVGVEAKTPFNFMTRMTAYQVAGAPSSFDKIDCVARGVSNSCTLSDVCGANTVTGFGQ